MPGHRAAHLAADEVAVGDGARGQLGPEEQPAAAPLVLAPGPYADGVSPFWIWMQVLIVIFVLAGIIIGTVKLL
jgi:hypothetical protein